MVAAAVLFAIAAVGGAVMAAMRLGGRALPPVWIVIPHGILAAAGLVVLIMTVVNLKVANLAPPPTAVAALVGFVLAALGGFTLLFVYHASRRALSIPLMLVHGAVAVVSFIILLIGIFGL